MKPLKHPFLMASLGLMLFSCGSPETEVTIPVADSSVVDSSAAKLDQEKEFKLHMIIANIPSPSHEIVAINKAGYKYDSKLLMDQTKAGSYSTEFKKGVTYGMYSADLAYVASFKGNKDLLACHGATRKAAESANVLKVFEEITPAAGFEAQKGNPDSLEAALDRLYVASENYFESDKHMDIAANVLAGAWIEGQYLLLSAISTQIPIAIGTKAELELKTKVWEAKIHLNNLNELLKEYPDNKDLAPVAASLLEYYKDYDGISAADQFTKEKTDKMLADINAIRTKLAE